jgi:HEAT repeat protein
MPLSEIAQALVRRGVITRDAAVEAERRKKIYGGGLDTVLLELRATDEETLTSHLAEILGIPAAPSSRVEKEPEPAAKKWIDDATAQRLGAVPMAKRNDALDVLVRPDHDHDMLVAWAAERALLIEPMLITEVRFRGLLRTLYDIPVPPRYLALLARLVGTANARALAGDRARVGGRTSTTGSGVDEVETLLIAARLGDAQSRRSALRLLARRLDDPRVIAFRHALEKKAAGNDGAATGALRAIAELRDKTAVPAVVELLETGNEEVAAAAQAALVALTCEDLGRKTKRWLEWWEKMGSRTRLEWLLDGLAHRTPELRLAASNELYEISGEYFGYHYDLPERDREEARQRWIAWWQNR